MMEPVAWMFTDPDGDLRSQVTCVRQKETEDTHSENGLLIQPLVRLSDAEARIEAERLRFEGDLDKWMKAIGAGISGYQPEAYAVMDAACNELVRLRARAGAAEALLKDQEAKIERLMLFGGRMANACYNIGQKPKPSHMDMVDLLFAQAEWDKAVRAARAIHDKIGVKDE